MLKVIARTRESHRLDGRLIHNQASFDHCRVPGIHSEGRKSGNRATRPAARLMHFSLAAF